MTMPPFIGVMLSSAAFTGLILASEATSGGSLGDSLIALGTLVAAIYVVFSSRAIDERVGMRNVRTTAR